jgi:HSP90 family molecular chaperone
VDIETRRKKQQALIVHAVERKVRTRAQQLYESRGQEEGQELQDWFQAESEVLEKNAAASLYRRLRNTSSEQNTSGSMTQAIGEEPARCDTSA